MLIHPRQLVGPAFGVARRPSLWPTAIRQLGRLATPGWWRHPPFLPLPPADYLRFRLQTQYGDAEAAPKAADIVSYLMWVRRWDHNTVRR
jgi:hypothetical protein